MSEFMPSDVAQFTATWVPLKEPVRFVSRLLNGQDHEFVYEGALRIEWGAPDGRCLMMPMHEDPGPENYGDVIATIVRGRAQREGRRDERDW